MIDNDHSAQLILSKFGIPHEKMNPWSLILVIFWLIVNLKLLIAYGSLGKLFHLKEFSAELEKQNIQVKLIKDTDYSNGFPSKKISDWYNGDKKFKKLIKSYAKKYA